MQLNWGTIRSETPKDPCPYYGKRTSTSNDLTAWRCGPFSILIGIIKERWTFTKLDYGVRARGRACVCDYEHACMSLCCVIIALGWFCLTL